MDVEERDRHTDGTDPVQSALPITGTGLRSYKKFVKLKNRKKADKIRL